MSLELSGTVTGHIRKYEVHADSSNDGKTANVDIDVLLNEEEAREFGGKLFAETCFSDYVGRSSATTVKSKKLGGELEINQEHTMEIDGHKIVTQPKITSVVIGEGQRIVTVTLRLPVTGSQKKIRRMLDESCGGDIQVKVLGVTQPEIPQTDDSRHGFDGDGGEPAA